MIPALLPIALGTLGIVAADVAVATQALARLAKGEPTSEVVRALVAADPLPDGRQIGLVDDDGGAYDEATRHALSDRMGWENLEHREQEGAHVDALALAHLRRLAGEAR